MTHVPYVSAMVRIVWRVYTTILEREEDKETLKVAGNYYGEQRKRRQRRQKKTHSRRRLRKRELVYRHCNKHVV